MNIHSTNINFRAGLTRQLKQEIHSSDIDKISRIISNHGIQNDFKGNKLIAWCSLKCLEIVNKLNNDYNLKLGLPKEIFVEDFKWLNVSDKNAAGVTNFAPTQLYKENNTIIPERTIFFNEFKSLNYSGGNEYWDRIDAESDANFENRISATDFFMEVFFHEFSHTLHEDNLINKFGGEKTVQKIKNAFQPLNIRRFRDKSETLLKSICEYAALNPFEAVACDLSKRFIENIDKNKLSINNNILSKSPYEKPSFMESVFKCQNHNPLNKLLRKLWNGKFDI